MIDVFSTLIGTGYADAYRSHKDLYQKIKNSSSPKNIVLEELAQSYFVGSQKFEKIKIKKISSENRKYNKEVIDKIFNPIFSLSSSMPALILNDEKDQLKVGFLIKIKDLKP